MKSYTSDGILQEAVPSESTAGLLYTEYGLMLNAPSYTEIDDEIGFVTRVYPGVKENGSIFSHPNPWAWCAEARLGRGDGAMKFYNALLPVNQNDEIEVRQSEPYSCCQFVMGKDHTSFGRARHLFPDGIRRLQITVLTGYRDFEYAERAIRPGVTRFLLKPSKMNELEEALQAMTENLARLRAGAPLNRYTGKSFCDLLNQTRIGRAERLMMDPSLKIHEISDMLGFNDVTHFSRIFKKSSRFRPTNTAIPFINRWAAETLSPGFPCRFLLADSSGVGLLVAGRRTQRHAIPDRSAGTGPFF